MRCRAWYPDLVFYSIALVIVAVLVFCLVACSALPAIEVCYVHPQYGRVCVKLDGKLYFTAELTDAQRLEVEAWIQEQRK